MVDEAQFSDHATLGSSLLQRMAEVPDVRQEKVDHLRQAVNEGTYSVSSDQIADAMLNDLNGLTGRS